MDCSNEHGRMELKSMVRELLFRGKRVKFRARHYVCPVCGIEADDLVWIRGPPTRKRFPMPTGER